MPPSIPSTSALMFSQYAFPAPASMRSSGFAELFVGDIALTTFSFNAFPLSEICSWVGLQNHPRLIRTLGLEEAISVDWFGEELASHALCWPVTTSISILLVVCLSSVTCPSQITALQTCRTLVDQKFCPRLAEIRRPGLRKT